MTFFLKSENDPVRRGPNADLSTSWDGISAAARREWRDVDVWRQRERQIIADRGDLALEAAKRLGPAGLAPLVTEFNEKSRGLGLNERIIPDGARPEQVLDLLGPQGAKRIVEMGREAAQLDPEGWKDVDLSDEGIEARVTERRVAAEKADAEDLALSPNPALNSLIGQIGAGVLDPVNLALMPFGAGGGSLLRIMGREAMLGAFAEGIQYPTRTKTAEELGKPAPDLMQSLAMGAIGGALVGGVIDAVPRALRGYRYWQALRSPKGVPGVSDVTAEVAVRKAEQAISAGENPLDAVRTALANESPPPREPLILTPAYRVTPEPTPLAPDPITTEPLPPEIEPPVPEGFIRMYHGGETKADGDVLPNTFTTDRRLAERYSGNGEMSYVDVPKDADELEAAAINDFRTSLTRTLDPEKWGGLKKAQPVQPATPGETAALAARALDKATKKPPKYPILSILKKNGGIDPGSWLARELKTMGVDQKFMPGLIKRGGQKEADTLVPEEWDDVISGFSYQTGRDATGNYLDRDGFIRAIDDEVRGIKRGERAQAEEAYRPDEVFVEAQPAEDGFFIDPNGMGFMSEAEWADNVGRGLDDYLNRKGLSLLDDERAEALDTLIRRGGDASHLVERIIERGLKEEKAARRRAQALGDWNGPIRSPEEVAPGAAGRGGQPAGRPDAAAGEPGQRGAPAGEPYRTERTPEGEQFLVPGTERVATGEAQRQKAEIEARQLQSKIGRLNQTRVEDDASGLFALRHIDMFDDLASPEAQAFMDAEVASMRDMEGGDFSAIADDGRQLDSLQDILDEIDESDALLREFQKCRAGDIGDAE